MTFVVGKVRNNGTAPIDGTDYSRAGVSQYVPPGVDTVFLTIGRTPFAIAAGGYYAPPDEA